MKQQKIVRNDNNQKPLIVNERQQTAMVTSNIPLRTVFYVEVGDMEPFRVQLLIQELNKMYDGARGGIHYVIPVRNGKIGSDIIFESEILDMVKKICEVNSQGTIILKEGATKCQIVREHIN